MSKSLTTEQRLARRIMGGESHPCMSDAYKWAMAQAGFPLRIETFYLTCRRGGPLFISFDLKAVVREFLPKRLPNGKERGFLGTHGYGLTPAMEKALLGDIEVWCAPKGTWVLPGEPILTVTGPSFLVSWLEPLAIMLNFPLQVATHCKTTDKATTINTTCDDEKAIVELAGISVGMTPADDCWPLLIADPVAYKAGVAARVASIKDALGGEIERAFEVGMRAATCMQQHRLALEACKEAGLLKTSNVYLAWELYMIPVGTTGHEHQQRWGDDASGFRAIRDMRMEPPSYLFDTVEPLLVGIPTAVEVMREDTTRACSIRFDSGDQDAQLKLLLKLCHAQEEFHTETEAVVKHPALSPNTIFEDGYTDEKTKTNEAYCDGLGWPKERRFYGYGGFIVYDPAFHPFGRDKVSACFKLTMTAGSPRMKHSGTPGKASIPGKPVIYRATDPHRTPPSLIAQEGEACPAEYSPLGEPLTNHRPEGLPSLSEATFDLVDHLKAKRTEAIKAAKNRALTWRK